MTRLKGAITALAALAFACSCTRAADDEYSVKEKSMVPAVTNVAAFVVNATNDTASALLPQETLFKDAGSPVTNKDIIGRRNRATNVPKKIQ